MSVPPKYIAPMECPCSKGGTCDCGLFGVVEQPLTDEEKLNASDWVWLLAGFGLALSAFGLLVKGWLS